MAGIKNPSMRDYLPTKMQRFQSGGLLGLLSGPTQQEKDIAQAYANFAQGLQPQAGMEGVNLPVTGEATSLPATQGQPDYNALLSNLVASGPQGLGQAKVLAGMLGTGKSQRPTSPTTTALAIRAGGDTTGIPAIDAITPEHAKTALRSVAGFVTIPGVGPEGQPTRTFKSKVDVLGAGAGGGPSVTGTTPLKPLPQPVQSSLNDAVRGFRSLDQMKGGIDISGRVTGNIAKAEAFFGKNQPAVDFQTARKNYKLAAQSLIKGIPSNFDVQTVIDTLPELGLPKATNVSRQEFGRKSLRDLLRLTLAYYKGVGYRIPPAILNLAKSRKINPNQVEPWDGVSDPFAQLQNEVSKFNSQSKGTKVGRFTVVPE